MPHLCSPKPKEEKDKSGHACTVIDVVFNTEVLTRTAAAGPLGTRWKEMAANT